MLGHQGRLRENDDLPVWRASATKKEPPFRNMRALDAVFLHYLSVRTSENLPRVSKKAPYLSNRQHEDEYAEVHY